MKLLSLFTVLALTSLSNAQWWVGHTKDSAASISYNPNLEGVVEGNNFKTIDGAMGKLVDGNSIKQLDRISIRGFFQDAAFHDELLTQLRLIEPEKSAKVLETNEKFQFHDYPLHKHLKQAFLQMEQFKRLQPLLAKHGLKVDRVNSEKFHSFKNKQGKVQLFGGGIWLSVSPIRYGLETVNENQDSQIYIQKLVKIDDVFVAEFQIQVGDEDVRLYGKWSAEHKCYVAEAYQIGYLENDQWKATDKKTGKGSFKLKGGTDHKIRILLGGEYYSRARLRLHGPKGYIDSEGFNMYSETR